jgi:hypothetical protein
VRPPTGPGIPQKELNTDASMSSGATHHSGTAVLLVLLVRKYCVTTLGPVGSAYNTHTVHRADLLYTAAMSGCLAVRYVVYVRCVSYSGATVCLGQAMSSPPFLLECTETCLV